MDHYFTNNTNLKSELKEINYTYDGIDFLFVGDNGVFSKSRIDYGSKTLLETFLKTQQCPSKVLDVGCGYGYMGIVIAKICNSNVTMSDVNKRALHLTKMNCEKNNVKCEILESSSYESIKDKYDVIITNPPVRVGKKVILDILLGAKEHLNADGALWYVLRKDQGAKSIEKILKEHYKVENVKKSNGFYIFCCKNR